MFDINRALDFSGRSLKKQGLNEKLLFVSSYSISHQVRESFAIREDQPNPKVTGNSVAIGLIILFLCKGIKSEPGTHAGGGRGL